MIRRDFLTVLGGGASSLVTVRGGLFNPFNSDSPDLEKRAAKIIREYDAQVLTLTREMREYFEKAAEVSGDARTAAKWVMGDLAGAWKAEGQEMTEARVTA